jgi:cell division protein FtsW
MTGVTLPFISYGGTSMMTTLFSVGILLGISREQSLTTDKPGSTKKQNSRQA